MAAGGGRPSLLSRRGLPNKWQTLFATCLGLGMLMIDTFVVNVAFPAIGRDLNASLSTAEWTVSAYVLVVGVFPIAMGRLGDIFGRKKVYMTGLAVFVLASVLCGMAQSIEQLIAFRVLQGLGAATMFPGTLSIITKAFPPEQRGLAIGIWGGVSGLGLIAGPLLGGLLVHGDNWRWIFFVNLPVGAIALVHAALFVPESRDETVPRSVDWAGLALLSTGLVALMFGITRGTDAGWGSPLILGSWFVAAALLVVFVGVERRVRYPLVDLSLFRSVTFVMACLTALLFSAAVFGSQPYFSLFMQNYWGFTPLQSGLAFIPATVLVAGMMPLSGIIGQRLGPRLRLLIITGSIAVLISALYLLRLDTESRYVDGLLPAFLIRGIGIGLVMSSTSLAVMSAVPLAKAGLASGTQTMARNIGTAMGVALFGAVFLHHVDSELPVRLEAAPPEQVAQITRAAEHFIPTGDGAVRLAVEEAIVDGFVLISLVTVVIAGLAMATAFFIRHRLPASDSRTVAVPAAERTAGSPSDGTIAIPLPSRGSQMGG
jgi:DHA2 family methylenomycin A resistance protein-like MFS transporter